MTARIQWDSVLERAASIVYSYSTRVTLRQLFYRLVSEGLVPNTTSAYKRLSSLTAEARRMGDFPALMDRTRKISRPGYYEDLPDAVTSLVDGYRLDRTVGQDVSVVIGVEKDGLVAQLETWFSPRGLPVVALRGYASQSIVDDVIADVYGYGRPGVLIYAGDFDPSGEDILRDFEDRADCFAEIVHIALTPTQVIEFNLPPMMGKSTDSRAGQFVARHGELVQVELDALTPDDLRWLYEDAVAEFWNDEAYQSVLDQENRDKSELEALLEGAA